MRRVTVGRTYQFSREGFDCLWSHCDAQEGQVVRVVNLPGAPRANTMGHCHIETVRGEFLGMCDVRSLHSVPKEGK